MSDKPPAVLDDGLWTGLRRLTAARIGLQRTGASLATGPLLDFKLAHAQARDAVHEPLDEARLIADLARLGTAVLGIASAAEQRQQYLMRPDLGRRLADVTTTGDQDSRHRGLVTANSKRPQFRFRRMDSAA